MIGASILYQLTQKGYKPVLLERAEVAAAASGKSGGFLGACVCCMCACMHLGNGVDRLTSARTACGMIHGRCTRTRHIT